MKIQTTQKMQRKREILLIIKGLICITTLSLLITMSMGGESSEYASFISFIQAIDPKNVLRFGSNTGLVPNPCLKYRKGVKCNLEGTRIIAIKLENLGISGKIDGKSLCNLQKLQFLSLARNQIIGDIPNSIVNCTSLTYLNLSNNLLNGNVPSGLIKLKNLRKLDLSNNCFPRTFRLSKQEVVPSDSDSMGPSAVQSTDFENSRKYVKNTKSFEKWKTWLPFVIGIVFLLLVVILVNVRSSRLAKEEAVMKSLSKSPVASPQEKEIEVKREEIRSKLVFFVGESERFRMENLLEGAADLRCQGLCSSLYKVRLKNGTILAVKKLKKLNVSLELFSETFTRIGNLNHPNILPLVGFNCVNEEKLLIYRYQSYGSLLTLQENHCLGKRKFPFKLRLSIVVGIARGLNFIYQTQSSKDEEEIIPHGNIKPSNILLNEHGEPLISEYGYTKFIDPKTASLFYSKGYTPPERSVSQEGDTYSFGVILLELLTGKMVEKSGLDLPKWVKSMVREEWTGEVFDKDLRQFEMFSFSLLNIALKCVAHFLENRPSIGEVLEKIEEVVSAFQDFSYSSSSSIDYSN